MSLFLRSFLSSLRPLLRRIRMSRRCRVRLLGVLSILCHIIIRMIPVSVLRGMQYAAWKRGGVRIGASSVVMTELPYLLFKTHAIKNVH